MTQVRRRCLGALAALTFLGGCQWTLRAEPEAAPIRIHHDLVFQPETDCPTESVHAETGKWYWLFPNDNYPSYVELLSDAACGRPVVYAAGSVTPDRPIQLLKIAVGLAAGLIFDKAFVRDWRDGVLPAVSIAALAPYLLPTHVTLSVDADVVAASGRSASPNVPPVRERATGSVRPAR